jgi:hypothetical protein
MRDSINECKYISILGFMNLFDSKKIYNLFSNTPDYNKLINGKDGDTIYIMLDKVHIDNFINIVSYITYRFILILQEGDETFPDYLLTTEEFINLMNNKYLIKCYSSNCNYINNYHEKLYILPIGLNYHNFRNSPIIQEQELENIKNNVVPFYDRKIMCYGSFHFNMNNRGYKHRKKALDEIPTDLIFYEPHRVDTITTWKNQSNYAFVVSPIGNGIDCFRTWEALILGCIVIVEKNQFDSLYESLPVLIVDNYGDITNSLLIDTINKFKNITFNYNKLYISYWKDIIQ